jgi:hypothetical protein
MEKKTVYFVTFLLFRVMRRQKSEKACEEFIFPITFSFFSHCFCRNVEVHEIQE